MTNTFPPLSSTVGKHGKSLMPPDGRLVTYVIKDEVRAFQDKTKDKVLIIQLMELNDGRYEIRVGYYIIGKLPKMKGKWVWGQFAAFMPLSVFQTLVEQATQKGWFAMPRKKRANPANTDPNVLPLATVAHRARVTSSRVPK